MTNDRSPGRETIPGLVLGVGLGGAALTLGHILPPSFLRNDITLALLLGGLVTNTPLHRLLGDRARYKPGLDLIGRGGLQLTVVLMGLLVQAGLFNVEDLALVVGVMFVTLPGSFLVAQALGARLGVSAPLTDLVAGGTMICGASAANALAPVVRAEREELGVAIATIFAFSLFALAVFHPVAAHLRLDAVHAGLWSGLAVNDFASALAVGQQMGGVGGAMAAVAKSSRILLLTPTLLAFRALRARGEAAATPRGWRGHVDLPGYLVGYGAMAAVRVIGDHFGRGEPLWHALTQRVPLVVNAGMVVVGAAIGLSIDRRTLARTGPRALGVGAGASLFTAASSLAVVFAVARDQPLVAVAIGAASLGIAFALYLRSGAAARSGRVVGSPRALALTLLLCAVVPLGLGVPKVLSISRRRDRAARTVASQMMSPRVAALRRAVYDPRCPAGMAYVPAGSVNMGSNDGFSPDELPIHEVLVGAFCLDVTEVTVAEYRACVDARRCRPVDNTTAWPDLSDADAAQWDAFCNDNQPGRGDHPANCVDWEQSDGYCRVHGGRLPTEPEWEYAARGGDQGRRYAWGDAPPGPTRGNLCGTECADVVRARIRSWSPLYPTDDGWVGTAPVGLFPAGDGRWGQRDLSGNVTEWLASPYCPYPRSTCDSTDRTARGNGYLANLDLKIRAARRNHDVVWHRSPDTGFRCAAAPRGGR